MKKKKEKKNQCNRKEDYDTQGINKKMDEQRKETLSKKRKWNEMVRLTISHGVTKAILSGNVQLAFA